MRSDGYNFSYFPKNKITKLANLVQFKRIGVCCPLVYATALEFDLFLICRVPQICDMLYDTSPHQMKVRLYRRLTVLYDLSSNECTTG